MFQDTSLIEKNDVIGLSDGRETVCNYDHEAVFGGLVQRLHQILFGFRIERGRGLVENQDLRIVKKGLGEYLSTEGKQLARVLSLQTSSYLMAAWKVTGKEQIPVETAAAGASIGLLVPERVRRNDAVFRA